MRRTPMPITKAIMWLQDEQKAEARKRHQLQKRKHDRLQRQHRSAPKPSRRGRV